MLIQPRTSLRKSDVRCEVAAGPHDLELEFDLVLRSAEIRVKPAWRNLFCPFAAWDTMLSCISLYPADRNLCKCNAQHVQPNYAEILRLEPFEMRSIL